jgi:hypothetical protein
VFGALFPISGRLLLFRLQADGVFLRERSLRFYQSAKFYLLVGFCVLRTTRSTIILNPHARRVEEGGVEVFLFLVEGWKKTIEH